MEIKSVIRKVDPRAEKTSALSNIINSATELFAKKSYEAVSINEIAKKAKVSKANVYHYFKSKEDLFTEIIKNIISPHAEFTEKLFNKKISSKEKLWQLVKFDFVDSHQKIDTNIRLVDLALSQKQKLSGEHGKSCFSRNLLSVMAIFEQGQVNGGFRKDLAPQTAALIWGAIVGFYFRNRKLITDLSPIKPFSRAEFAKQIFLFMLEGFNPPNPQKNNKIAVKKQLQKKFKNNLI